MVTSLQLSGFIHLYKFLHHRQALSHSRTHWKISRGSWEFIPLCYECALSDFVSSGVMWESAGSTQIGKPRWIVQAAHSGLLPGWAYLLEADAQCFSVTSWKLIVVPALRSSEPSASHRSFYQASDFSALFLLPILLGRYGCPHFSVEETGSQRRWLTSLRSPS